MAAGSVAAPRLIPLRAPGHGRAGHEVDTATPVEIKSDSADVQLYYTLDGSAPEAGRPGRANGGSTRRYGSALLLPPGKVSVKAVAVTRDGRQSSTVTKVFLVSLNEAALRGKKDLQDKEVGLETLQLTGRSTPSRSSLKCTPDVLRSSGGARLLNGRLGSQDPQVQRSSHREPSGPNELQAKQSPSQSTRVLQEVDFLRCTRCLCDRPSDPFSRFCIQCGSSLPPIPGQRLPPPEAARMGVCLACNTLVPINTPTCLICEASIPLQLSPQASLRLQDKVLCVACGCVNPGHISHCVTCEKRLSVPSWTPSPPPPERGHKLDCSVCHRGNNRDARFCDWCSSKLRQPLSSVLCGGCGASNPLYASYCSACGLLLVAPPQSPASYGTAGGAWTHPQGSPMTSNQGPRRPTLSSVTCRCTSKAAPTQARAPPTVDRQTQTVGLFYPSSAELNKTHQQRALKEQVERRRPALTAVSPGRGYWRKQVDHVCAHLRAYAQNNPHFRTLLGEPRMGRMGTAVLKEDGFEVSLRLSFLPGDPGTLGTQSSRERRAGESPDLNQSLSSVTEGQNSTLS